MASLKNIKLKILSYKKTGTVTHAMEAVSAVKMRKGQERALSGRSYAAAALTVLERLAGTADIARHPLMANRDLRSPDIVLLLLPATRDSQDPSIAVSYAKLKRNLGG